MRTLLLFLGLVLLSCSEAFAFSLPSNETKHGIYTDNLATNTQLNLQRKQMVVNASPRSPGSPGTRGRRGR